MEPVQYTAERQAEAVTLYFDQGAAKALETIGCGRSTLYRWIGDELSRDTKKAEADAKDATLRQSALRQHLRERLITVAVRQLDRVLDPYPVATAFGGVVELPEPPAGEVQKLMVAVGIALDKYRLEMGEHTDRTQVVTLGVIESEIQRLEAELGKRAPENA